jgi:hypothetical protein
LNKTYIFNTSSTLASTSLELKNICYGSKTFEKYESGYATNCTDDFHLVMENFTVFYSLNYTWHYKNFFKNTTRNGMVAGYFTVSNTTFKKRYEVELEKMKNSFSMKFGEVTKVDFVDNSLKVDAAKYPEYA